MRVRPISGLPTKTKDRRLLLCSVLNYRQLFLGTPGESTGRTRPMRQISLRGCERGKA